LNVLIELVAVAIFGFFYYKYLERKRTKSKEMILADMTYFISRARYELYLAISKDKRILEDSYINKLKEHLDFAVVFNDSIQKDTFVRIIEMKDATLLQNNVIEQWKKLHSLSPVLLNCYFYYLTLNMEYLLKPNSKEEIKFLQATQKNRKLLAEKNDALELCLNFTQKSSKKNTKLLKLTNNDNEDLITLPYLFSGK